MLGESQPNKDVTVFVDKHTGDSATMLRTAISQWVYMFVADKRKRECQLCLKHGKTGGDQYKNLLESGHTCINSAHGKENKAPITDEEWKTATEKMLENQVVQAYLLCEELASPHQIVTLDVARFLLLRRQALDLLINTFLRDAVLFDQKIFRVAA